jgi:hypothetical protein
MDKVEIVMGGDVIASADNPKLEKTLTLKAKIPVEGTSWIAARTFSKSETLPFNQDIPVFGHTSPVYVDVPGVKHVPREDVRYFITRCNRAIAWAKLRASFLKESHREEMISLFEKAKGVYESMLKVPEDCSNHCGTVSTTESTTPTPAEPVVTPE